MEVEGKGTVILNYGLKNGNVRKFIMHNVLNIPNLNHALFSWKEERKNGYTLFDNGSNLCLVKNDDICLETDFNGPLPIIVEKFPCKRENAFMTYEFWHKALCHSAPSVERRVISHLNIQACTLVLRVFSCVTNQSG